MKKTLFFILLLLLVNSGYASTAAAFLDNGIAARSEAMGRAFTAVADDLDAFYYNPAGYAGQRSTRINTMGSKLNNIYDVYYLGGGIPLGAGYGAFNLFMTSLGDIPRTSYDGQYVVDSGEKFEYASRAFFFSYGLNASTFSPQLENLKLGFNLKYINEALDENRSNGFGLDAGLLYTIEKLNIGFTVLNLVEPQLKWDTDSGRKESVLRKEKLGFSYQLTDDFLLALDVTLQRNENLMGLGLEYLINKSFALRAGTCTNIYMLGLGYNYANFNFDYAYSQPAETIVENTHKVSIGYTFGGGKEKIVDAVAKIKSAEKSNTYQLPTLTEKKPTFAVQELVEPTANIIKEPQPQNEQALPAKLELVKKSVLAADGKVKCYYRLANRGGIAAAVKYTMILIDGKDVVRGQESGVTMIVPNAEELISQAFVQKGAAPFKVKVFFNNNEQQTLNFVNQVE